MSKPEIFRRCLGCGVSVRTRARFCPQCGRVVAEESPPAQSVTTRMKSLRRASDREAGTGVGRTSGAAAKKDDDDSEPAPSVGITPAAANRAVLYSEKETATKEAAASPVSASVATSEPLRQNGASAAPSPPPPRRRRSSIIVEENVMPHVEKIRETSLIVLDEASDDPGMRFVFIAVALFLLFLLFLLVSNYLK